MMVMGVVSGVRVLIWAPWPRVLGALTLGSMYPLSIYFGLKVVPGTLGLKYIQFGYMDP